MRRIGRAKKPAAEPKEKAPMRRPEVEAARSRIGSLMDLGSEKVAACMPDAIEAVKALPPHDAGPLLVETARKWQTAALPLLTPLLDDPEYASAAADALGFIRSEEVVLVLRSAERPGRPKAVVKSVRRALHRLKSQGVEVEEAAPPAPAAISLVPGRRILKSQLSSMDGHGDQFLSLIISAPLSGTEAVMLIANDETGVKDIVSARMTRREYEEHVEEMRERGHSIVDAPASYVLFRIREFEAINRAQGAPLPVEYQVYSDLFHAPGTEYERPLVYEEMDAEGIRADQSLSKRAKELFEGPEFEVWFVSEERIQPYALRFIEAEESSLVLSETAQEKRVERVFKSAAEELFTPEVGARYKRRLEENAYVLLHGRRKQTELARIALACALELSPDGPPPFGIPFVRELLTRSVGLFKAKQKRESRIHRVPE